jgi:ATP-binding cassette ChvD family protein
VAWLEQYLAGYKGTVIAITHDRYFLDNVAGWILELDRGEGIPYKGNYTNWLEQKTARMAMEEKTESKRQRVLKQELEWVRSNASARRTKSKARLQNYEKMQGESVKEKEAKLEIYIPNGQRLGDKVIEFNKVTKGFGDRLLFENLSFALPPAGIVGIIGPNGAGKTTLFRLIQGEEKPDAGTVTIGDTVQIAYVDQSHKDLSPEKTVWEVLSNSQEMMLIGGTLVNSRAYLSRFNFSGPDQNKKVGVLSGGERNRLHLAMTLKNGSNVLLLDEPTNDLDVNTLRALEEGIQDYSGCAVIISHDRWFLDRVCTHILAFESESNVYWFEGSFSDYQENYKKRVGDIVPHRIKYRKLVRG